MSTVASRIEVARTGPVSAPDLANSGAPVLMVHGLRRKFGDRTILDGASFSIEPGEIVALLGASGSGKSTILRVIAGLDQGATGTIVVPDERSVVFQDHRLLPWKKVWRNVVVGMEDGSRSRALEALTEVGLEGRVDAWPNTLSGGEAQRVALARAFIREPRLLLLDEPFGALDALTRLRAQWLLADLCVRYQPAVLLITHDVEEAVLLADRVLVLEEGQISTDISVSIDRPRQRTGDRFIALREQLLGRLGVDDGSRGQRL